MELNMNINEFRKLPVMGILRGIDASMISPLCEAIISSGLKTVEITMNTCGAPDLIRQMKDAAGGRLMIGAGTVLSMDDLHSALEAGATFIVMPTLVHDVTRYCCKNNIPVFPGALTPQEIYDAWCAGATMVKVFPVKFFGPSYLGEVKGPFQDIELLACGGVSDKNIKTCFSVGASAISFGGSIFKREWLEKGEFDKIRQAIVKLIYAFQNVRQV